VHAPAAPAAASLRDPLPDGTRAAVSAAMLRMQAPTPPAWAADLDTARLDAALAAGVQAARLRKQEATAQAGGDAGAAWRRSGAKCAASAAGDVTMRFGAKMTQKMAWNCAWQLLLGWEHVGVSARERGQAQKQTISSARVVPIRYKW